MPLVTAYIYSESTRHISSCATWIDLDEEGNLPVVPTPDGFVIVTENRFNELIKLQEANTREVAVATVKAAVDTAEDRFQAAVATAVATEMAKIASK